MANSNRGRLDHALAAVATVLLLLALLAPGNSVPPSQETLFSRWVAALPAEIDKLVHALLFCLETHLLSRSMRHVFAGRRSVLASAAAAAALAAITEGGQLWVPHRSFELLDLLANSVGILVAALWALRKYQNVTISPHSAAVGSTPQSASPQAGGAPSADKASKRH